MATLASLTTTPSVGRALSLSADALAAWADVLRSEAWRRPTQVINQEKLCPEDMAVDLGVSADAITKRCRRGEINGAFRIGKLWKITKQDWERYKARLKR